MLKLVAAGRKNPAEIKTIDVTPVIVCRAAAVKRFAAASAFRYGCATAGLKRLKQQKSPPRKSSEWFESRLCLPVAFCCGTAPLSRPYGLVAKVCLHTQKDSPPAKAGGCLYQLSLLPREFLSLRQAYRLSPIRQWQPGCVPVVSPDQSGFCESVPYRRCEPLLGCARVQYWKSRSHHGPSAAPAVPESVCAAG